MDWAKSGIKIGNLCKSVGWSDQKNSGSVQVKEKIQRLDKFNGSLHTVELVEKNLCRQQGRCVCGAEKKHMNLRLKACGGGKELRPKARDVRRQEEKGWQRPKRD